jgi:Uma2 family endonuclease
MIVAKDKPTNLTPEEYFAWEEQQLEKHELIDGQVYAMTGGSVNHSRIAIRFTTMFDTHLDASSCITGNSDLRGCLKSRRDGKKALSVYAVNR